MPSPFAFDTTSPADSMAENVFPASARTDKITMSTVSATGGVLGTLKPFGTPTTGWRDVQDDNKHWLAWNAYLSGHAGTWNRDDIAVESWLIEAVASANLFTLYWAGAAANPVTWIKAAEFKSAASAVNYVQFVAAATGAAARLQAQGSDATVNLDLFTKAGRALQLVDLASIVNYFQMLPSIATSALQLAAAGTDANITMNAVPKGTGTFQVAGRNIAQTPAITSIIATGTYTTPAWAQALWVRIVGGGGGGGGGNAGSGAGGGGGAGAYSEKLIAGPAASYVATIGTAGSGGGANAAGGAGGASSFGAVITAVSGGLGGGGGGSQGGSGATGSAPGTGGDVNIAGAGGGVGNPNTSNGVGGPGGSSPFGGAAGGSSGNAGANSGSGGSGGSSGGTSGGNGGTGLCIVVAF